MSDCARASSDDRQACVKLLNHKIDDAHANVEAVCRQLNTQRQQRNNILQKAHASQQY